MLLACITPRAQADEPLRVGVFDVDASPPIGSPLAYDPTKEVTTPLSCRGVVIAGAGDPIVLCAIDWIGVGGGGQTVFRRHIAEALGTLPQRIVIHALHQHDAPRCDFSVDEILNHHGIGGTGFDPVFARRVVEQTAAGAREALASAQPVTHLGLGEGVVEKVASNRRILGADGKVLHMRFTATRDPAIRAYPAGTIDPQCKLIAFYNDDEPLAALTYYATHPQSYYRTGQANPDFPGMARNARQETTGVPHIHFNGAGGNIGAGKWNDGAHENRQVLADRVAEGMRRAWECVEKTPISSADVSWLVEPIALPVSPDLNEAELQAAIEDSTAQPRTRYDAARKLVWLRRCEAGDTIDIACLGLKSARILHMPGELFVEYQLAAQDARPDLFVAMAAYGDYTPGYIGTEIAYTQGGYETSPRASNVAPSVEIVLMGAIDRLLEVDR